ncbi:MAG TPA: hypothetical protein VGD68_16660 [Streptosporangiaceae bacterium]
MTQSLCANCRGPLGHDDMFCGNCGQPRPAASPAFTASTGAGQPTGPVPGRGRLGHESPDGAGPAPGAAPWPSTAGDGHPWVGSGRTATRPRPAEVPAEADGFFGHARQHLATQVSNATRYLCAAAYLNPGFANVVLGELVASRRAVVPSLDIDLGPIIRHCLSARKLQLTRDLVLTVLLIAGLFFATLPVIAVLALAFLLAFLPGIQWDRKSMGVKLLAGVGLMATVGTFVILWIGLALLNQVSRTVPHFGPLATGAGIVIAGLIFLALISVTMVAYSYNKFTILGEQLDPGAVVRRTERAEEWVESRIAEVEAAQGGNVTLYSGENPFIGTGKRQRVWSIAIELNRAHSSNRWVQPEARGYAPIDPVELHQVIRERLLRLKDPDLPGNERISALAVDHHVVGEGQRRWDSPLIDPSARRPYSQASPEAIDALIRHPQAGMRYYQRVSVSDEGQEVWANQRLVIGSADQEVGISAFIYTAVEGRMFYLEFVSTVLPPIHRSYHVIDMLPKISSVTFLAKVLLGAASSAFADMVAAPARLLSTLRRMMRERRSFRQEIASADDYLLTDMGARLSVRELGAERSPHTYLQKLDAEKYIKIIERLVTDTVLDFLVAKGVDASAYRNDAQMVINSGVMISGGTFTNVAMASQGAATQTAAPATAH